MTRWWEWWEGEGGAINNKGGGALVGNAAELRAWLTRGEGN